MAALGAIWLFIGALVIQVAGMVLSGWVLHILWSWFVVPTLGLPELSVVEAVGIGMTLSFVTNQWIDPGDADGDALFARVQRQIISIFLRPLVALGVGWVFVQFMP